MQKRVRVRRERPTALSWALALAVTMLAVYLVTLNRPDAGPAEETSAGPRITREITLEGMEMYFADLGAYPDETNARIAAASYAPRGAAGVVLAQPDGYHVLGAGYALEADAERIAKRLTEQESLSSCVLRLSAPSVALRITARDADTDAIADADRLLQSRLDQIASMALQIDRGELPSASARTLAQVARSELKKAAKTLSRVGGAESQPVCTQLLAQLHSLADELDALARSGASGAALSGQLRCCHVSGNLRRIDFLNALSDG